VRRSLHVKLNLNLDLNLHSPLHRQMLAWTAPDLMDTLLGGIRQFFVLSWAEIAQA
jgi:hypothetical protein